MSVSYQPNNCSFEDNVLHIEKGVKQRIDELSCKNHETREVSLKGCVDVFIFIGSYLKILLKLCGEMSESQYAIY